MAVSNAFVWGRGGAQLTPEQIAKQREIEEAMLQKGIDTSPVGSVYEGIARVANAAAGSFRRGRLDEAEAENTKLNTPRYNEMISLLAGVPAPAPGATPTVSAPRASIPSPGAAAEVAATSPAVATAGVSGLPDATELNTYLADESKRATLPAGMRNNNPGNIKFVGQKVPGIVGPSVNTDQGDPQAVFDTPENGMRAMHTLLLKKYNGGKLTPNQIIAGNMGWTPGNFEAAANVARYAGINPDDDIGMNDPAKAAKFMRGLMMQEHGKSSALYPDSMILSALTNGAPTQVASLDPSAAMPPAAAAIETAAPAFSYVDPMVSVRPNTSAAAVPSLDAPRTVSPAPSVAAVPQQVAQNQGAFPPAPTAPNGTPIPRVILDVLSDPRSDARTRGIAELVLKQNMSRQQAEQELRLKQSDPAYQLGLDKARLEVENLRNPRVTTADKLAREKFEWDKQNAGQTADIKEYQYAVDRGYQGSFVDFQLAQKKAGAASTNVNVGEGDKFYENLDKKNAETFAAMSDAGIQARSKLGQINRLEGLFANIPQGVEGGFKKLAGDWGINLGEGTNDIQAASALLEKMVPEQRQPGSGNMSDADIKMFRASLPRVLNQPGGNKLIFDTMRGIADYEAKMGEIADQVADRTIKPAEGRRLIRELKNPLADYKIPEGSGKGASTTTPPAAPSQPPEGIDANTWKFMTPEERTLWQK